MKNERGFVKIVVVVVVLAIAVAGAYYYYTHRAVDTDTAAQAALDRMHETDATTQPEGQYVWVFTDLGSDTGVPKTHVALIAKGAEHDIGDYDGTCSKQTADLLAGEKEKVVCWYAGGGHEIGIFDDSGKAVVKVGEVDEGSAEAAGFRGNFTMVLTI